MSPSPIRGLMMAKRLRTCGTCQACCFTHVVTASEFPHGPVTITELFKPCKFQCGKGCAIYGQHPPACKAYQCAWLDGTLDCDRPDELGLVPDFYEYEGIEVLSLMETRKGSRKTRQASRFIRRMSLKHIVVITGPSGFCQVSGPNDREQDLNIIIELMSSLSVKK